MDYIDLHLHSTCSDGTMSPSQLVHEAARRNIKAIAITDHDTIEGVEEALHEGKNCEVEILSGVEISAYLDDIPMHILGYGFHHTDAALQESLKKIQQARNDRNIAILKKLNDLGIDVTQADLKKQSKTLMDRELCSTTVHVSSRAGNLHLCLGGILQQAKWIRSIYKYEIGIHFLFCCFHPKLL